MKNAIRKASWIDRWKFAAGLAVGSALLAGCGGGTEDEDYANLDRSVDALEDQEAEARNTQELGSQSQSAAQQGARVQDSAEIALREEQLNVETRQAPAGGVVLRKTVTAEPTSESVELRREQIEVVRLSPEEARERMEEGASDQFSKEFAEEEVFIPIMQEEAVANKEVATREIVRARTEASTQQKEIEATLRREELETQRVQEDSELARQAQQQVAAANQDPQSQALKEQVIERIRSETDLSERQIEQIDVEVNGDREVVLSGSLPNDEVEARIREGVREIEGATSVAFNF